MINELDSQINQIRESGYCCLSNLIPSSNIEGICLDVSRDVKIHTDLPMPIGHVPGFLGINQSLAPFLTDRRVLSLVEAFFGPHIRISMHTGTVNGPGIERGQFHADWPYNQSSTARIPAPYPDIPMHFVTFWMLTDFTEDNGATFIVPGSHHKKDNPSSPGKYPGFYPQEKQLLGTAGTVAILDARLWHAIAPNKTQQERVAVIIRYAPWWLNLDPLRPGTVDRSDIVDAVGGKAPHVPAIPGSIFKMLPEELKPLLRHSLG